MRRLGCALLLCTSVRACVEAGMFDEARRLWKGTRHGILGHVKTRIVLLAAALLSAPTYAAQTFPQRPIRLVVPFPAGGATDVMARIVAAKLTDQLGQTVVIDNRGAASGIVGTEVVANAVPDGYTLLHGS